MPEHVPCARDAQASGPVYESYHGIRSTDLPAEGRLPLTVRSDPVEAYFQFEHCLY